VLRERPMRFRMSFRTLWDGNGQRKQNSAGHALDEEPTAGERKSANAGKGSNAPQHEDFVPSLTEYLMESLEAPIAEHLDQWCIFRPLWSGMNGAGSAGECSNLNGGGKSSGRGETNGR
jgi:hypothetical protein